MRFLVTGGAGFIGTNLIKRLSKDGDEIVSLDNYSTGLKKNEQDGVLYHNVDISDYKNFDQFIEGIDLVFHLAALIGIPYSYIAWASQIAYLNSTNHLS